MNTSQLSRITEEEARKILENIRWPKGVICPHCGSIGAYKLQPKVDSKRPVRKGVWKCKSCLRQFTVTVGTIFEGGHIALRNWIYAFGRMCASKKGISALQLQRELGITYKTAWFICHRIRYSMKDTNNIKLAGIVEVDEAHIGGRPRYKGQSKRGWGTRKVPVLTLVERNGIAQTRVLNES